MKLQLILLAVNTIIAFKYCMKEQSSYAILELITEAISCGIVFA